MDGKGGSRRGGEGGEGREEGDGRTNPKPAATDLYFTFWIKASTDDPYPYPSARSVCTSRQYRPLVFERNR